MSSAILRGEFAQSVEERLSRWLLLISDLSGRDNLELSNELVACLLGSRISGVPLALGVRGRAGLIAMSDGELQLKDRDQLEFSAYQCYCALNMRQELL